MQVAGYNDVRTLNQFHEKYPVQKKLQQHLLAYGQLRKKDG